MYQMSSQSGKRGDGLSAVQRVHTVTSQIQNLRQSFCCRIYIFFVRNIFRCGTYQQISMDSRSYKDTFSHFGRELENGGIHQITAIFVHKTVLTSSGDNTDPVFTDHVMDLIRIDTCRIDNDGSKEHLSIRLYLIHPAFFLGWILTPYRSLFHNGCHLMVPIELHTILRCILRQCNVQSEGTDDTTGGCIQGSYDVTGHRRLHSPDFLRGQKLQFFYPVLHASLIQFFQTGHGIFFKA